MKWFAYLFLFCCQGPTKPYMDLYGDESTNKHLKRECWSTVENPGLRCREMIEMAFGSGDAAHFRVDLRDCAWDEAPVQGKFVTRIYGATNVIAVRCGGN